MGNNFFFDWSFPKGDDIPVAFDEMRFPITVNETSDAAGLFFAYHFYMNTGGKGFYTGVQPWAKEALDGEEPTHYSRMLFSAFNYDARTEDEGFCKGGADGDPNGVTCVIKNSVLVLNKPYTYRATQEIRNGRQYWTGTAWDEMNNVPVYHIGTYYFESAEKRLIRSSDVGFIEPFNSGDRGKACTVTFGRPIGLLNYKQYVGNKLKPRKPDDNSTIEYTIINETDDELTVKCRFKES